MEVEGLQRNVSVTFLVEQIDMRDFLSITIIINCNLWFLLIWLFHYRGKLIERDTSKRT